MCYLWSPASHTSQKVPLNKDKVPKGWSLGRFLFLLGFLEKDILQQCLEAFLPLRKAPDTKQILVSSPKASATSVLNSNRYIPLSWPFEISRTWLQAVLLGRLGNDRDWT